MGKKTNTLKSQTVPINKMKGFKSFLPTKLCATCGLKFAFRKKWIKNWEEVKYCSEKCRGNRSKNAGSEEQNG